MSLVKKLLSLKGVGFLGLLYYLYVVYKRIQLTKRMEQSGFKILNSHWFYGGLKDLAPEGLTRPDFIPTQIVDLGVKLLDPKLNQQKQKQQKPYVGFTVWVFSPYVPFAAMHSAVLDHNLTAEIISFKNSFSFPKASAYDESKPLIGHGVLSSEGEDWKYKRKLVESFFRYDVLKNYAMPILDEMTGKLFERLDTHPRIKDSKGREALFVHDVREDCLRFTAETIGKLSLGCDFGGLSKNESSVLYHAFEFVLKSLFYRGALPSLKYLPIQFNRKFDIEMNNINQIVYGIIDSQWDKTDLEEKNLLSSLLQRGPDGKHLMTKDQIADEVKTIVFAGHDTTAGALTWSFYLLGSHPDIQQKLYEEIISTLNGDQNGDDDDDNDDGQYSSRRRLSFEELDGMKYLMMFVKEVLRLYPSASFARKTLTDISLTSVTLPSNVELYFLPFFQHRNPHIWGDDASEFRPERWEENSVPETDLNKAYLPFALGPRNCVGNKLAYLEIKYLIVEMLRKYHIEVGKGTKAQYVFSLTMNPKDINIVLTPRKSL